MRWGIEQRLEFIEFRLFWEGAINRSDIVDHFGVSVPQASKDLSLYQERAPGNASYDTRSKRYEASDNFVLRFLDPDPDAYLSQLRSVAEGALPVQDALISSLPAVDSVIMPKRKVDLEILRSVLEAVRSEHSIEILYQSMNRLRPDPVWRRITPHAFGYDGARWHTRAFCHVDGHFKDFLLPRILGIRSVSEPGQTGRMDWLWNHYFDLVIAPHPKLTNSQKKVVSLDYGFEGDRGIIRVRYAMLFYALKRLGLLTSGEDNDPRTQHIVALNFDEAQKALNKRG
jgi:predicted DNA-binding transcriptional regulator YafY